jgi:hypothetical protein
MSAPEIPEGPTNKLVAVDNISKRGHIFILAKFTLVMISTALS